MPRRGERSPKPIPGDPADARGFPALVGDYLEQMGVRGYSPRTIDNQRAMLSYLAAWLDERGVSRPAEVTPPMLERYQRALYHRRKANGQPLSFRAQHSRLVPIRGFFRWAARRNHTLYNPASELELPRLEKRLPKAVLSASEAERILAVPDLTQPLGLRDRAMLELLYATGIRRSELANLALYDLDGERGTLMVRQGKGRKDRMVPLGLRAGLWCSRYSTEVRPGLAGARREEIEEPTLFLTVDGHPFSPWRLTQLIGAYVKASGVGKPGSCHLFRHTMATLMLEGGADIRFIQQMLGHAELTTTQIYTQVSLRKLAAIHAATHPGARNERHRSPSAHQEPEHATEPASQANDGSCRGPGVEVDEDG